MRRTRKSLTDAEKLRYISLAVEEIVWRRKRNPNYKPRTTIIGLACQYSSNPKLKPVDFKPLMDKSLKEIIETENLNIKII